jgi:heme-degrading monooxygenase HmoA
MAMAVVFEPETEQILTEAVDEEAGIEHLFLEYPATLAVTTAYRVAPGCGDVFLEICKRLAGEVAHAPQCRGFRVLRDRHDPLSYTVMSDWDSTTAYVEFERQMRLHHVERVMVRAFHRTGSGTFDVAWPPPQR